MLYNKQSTIAGPIHIKIKQIKIIRLSDDSDETESILPK